MFNERPQFNEVRIVENGKAGKALPAIMIEKNKLYYIPKGCLKNKPTHIKLYAGLLRFFFSENCDEDYKSFVKIPNGSTCLCLPNFTVSPSGKHYGNIEWA